MNLLEAFGRTCTVMEQTPQPDGAGGSFTAWQPGASFTACFGLASSVEGEQAQQVIARETYGILTNAEAQIHYDDRFVDNLTGESYRAASHPEAKRTPGTSLLNLKYFTAVKEVLPQ